MMKFSNEVPSWRQKYVLGRRTARAVNLAKFIQLHTSKKENIQIPLLHTPLADLPI